MKHILFLILFFSLFSASAFDCTDDKADIADVTDDDAMVRANITTVVSNMATCKDEMERIAINAIEEIVEENEDEYQSVLQRIRALRRNCQEQAGRLASLSSYKDEDSGTTSYDISYREEANACEEAYKNAESKLDGRKKEVKDEFERQTELANEQMDKTEEIQRQMQENCQNSHNSFKRERDSIERAVQRLEDRIDRNVSEIESAYAAVTVIEDRSKDKIEKAKADFNEVLNEGESKIIKATLDKKQLRTDALKHIDGIRAKNMNYINNISETQAEIQQACSIRFNHYINASKTCEDQARDEIIAERDSIFERIQSGYQVAALSNLFNLDSKSLQKMFQRRLIRKHKKCYREKVGENLPSKGQRSSVLVPCDLAALKRRNATCENAQNNKASCPQTAEARDIESDLLKTLSRLDGELTKEKQILEQSEKDLPQVNEQFKDRDQALQKGLESMEESLKTLRSEHVQKIESAENELTKARSDNENKILRLERERIRLLAQDPAKHMEETIWTAKSHCCQRQPSMPKNIVQADDKDFKAQAQDLVNNPGSGLQGMLGGGYQQCQGLNAYLNNPERWKRSVVDPRTQTQTSVTLSPVRNRSSSGLQ